MEKMFFSNRVFDFFYLFLKYVRTLFRVILKRWCSWIINGNSVLFFWHSWNTSKDALDCLNMCIQPILMSNSLNFVTPWRILKGNLLHWNNNKWIIVGWSNCNWVIKCSNLRLKHDGVSWGNDCENSSEFHLKRNLIF